MSKQSWMFVVVIVILSMHSVGNYGQGERIASLEKAVSTNQKAVNTNQDGLLILLEDKLQEMK